jgi:hypothetical protein
MQFKDAIINRMDEQKPRRKKTGLAPYYGISPAIFLYRFNDDYVRKSFRIMKKILSDSLPKFRLPAYSIDTKNGYRHYYGGEKSYYTILV